MTKLLEEGIEAVRGLPPDRQDLAGELLLTLAAKAPQFDLSAAQVEDLKIAITQADRGELASDRQVVDTWAKFGL